LLNNISADGIYNNGGNIGIRASAIRTGLLYSRNATLNPGDNNFAAIAKKAGCVIDLNTGNFSLRNSGYSFFITPGGFNGIFGTNHTSYVFNNN